MQLHSDTARRRISKHPLPTVSDLIAAGIIIALFVFCARGLRQMGCINLPHSRLALVAQCHAAWLFP